MMMRRSLCCLLSVLLLPGCSFFRDPTWIPTNTDEYGAIGILEEAVVPDTNIPSSIKDYGMGMMVGAVTGMIAWNALTDTSSVSTDAANQSEPDSTCKDAKGFGDTIACHVFSAIFGALLSLAATLTAGAVGALWGAVTTAAGNGPQPASIADAQQSITQTTTGTPLQSQFITRLQSIIDRHPSIHSTLYHQSTSHTLTAEYVFENTEGISTIIQTWIESINFKPLTDEENPRYSLIVRVRTNTYRRGTSSPVDMHRFEWEGEGFPLETWGENEASHLKAQLESSYRGVGEQITARLGFRNQPPPTLENAVVP